MSVKLSELTASTGITSDDLFLTTNDPGGTPQSRKATAQQVLDYITGSTFNTLTVTNLTGTNSQLTGSFSGTFVGDGSALTGIVIPVDNFTLGSTNIVLGTTESIVQGLSVITGSTVTGSTALFDNITASVALFTGDIRVLGTASIAQLNTVGQQSLVVGDKYITILSGGVDHTGINGAGFLWGTSSGPGETTGALGEHAHILYDSSRDALEIFPGLYVTGSTTLFGISGTTAQFTTISGSTISASSYIGLPVASSSFTPSISADLVSSRAFNTTYQNNTERTLWLQIILNCSSTGTRLAFVNQNFNTVNTSTGTVVYNESQEGGRNLTVHFYVPAGHYYKITTDTSANIQSWYEYELLGGGGDVLLSASNTFTGINTFNTNFVTASAGITGSIAQFTSITGSTFFSASNPSYWSGSAPTNIQDAINRVAAAIFNGLTGSIA